MDNLTPEQRRKNMQNIRSTGTKPEVCVAREIRRRKLYFTQNVKTIIGKPDFVFRKKKVVIFIDSDFWHGHPARCIMPKSNRSYWTEKIKKNRQRDRLVNKKLKKDGWTIVRLWEADLKKSFNRTFNKIISVLEK